MNVDLRAMEAQAEELRAQMRDVLTRKLGKPRRVDKTLDDLLRQMARRHKFSTTLGTIPQPLKSVDDMAGTYDAEVYLRDVALREEIKLLRLKPLSPRPPLPPAEPPWTQRDDIYLAKSRYEVVDMLVKKWLLKYGGDPSQYKKQTRAFDALAALADRLIREHMETLEGTGSHEVMQQLEGALKAVAGTKEPLNARLGPALAALFHTAQTADLESVETMASLVKSLVDDDHPLTAESLERIDIFDVIEDIREIEICGIFQGFIASREYRTQRAQHRPERQAFCEHQPQHQELLQGRHGRARQDQEHH
ncbi:hypothetical protein MSG28_006127 [Choristoneura fumiferana]|uniref:Uncharacterized protein n=1 Tax=Choristoneura fumiferana TaxID=7141 RepID=A0ACC0JDS4_CHOFU|nr:hypothetical protein MSG28_006127 [Choristoneura fumiferana]